MEYISKALGPVQKQKSSIRWLMLILCCFSTFGDFYCYDNIGATHDHLQDQLNLGVNFEYYYSLLYSIYSFANMILPILGGLFIVMFGIRLSFVLFGISICIGQLVFTLGSHYNSIIAMIIGRAIFSIGGENLQISQTALICIWFYKAEVALPLGLTITISRLGSSINDIVSPRIAQQNNATPAYWVGFLLSLISLLTIGLLCFIDSAKRDEREDHQSQQEGINAKELGSMVEIYNWSDFKKNLSEFGLLYWLITVICFLTYGTVMPFNFIIVHFLTSTHFKETSPSEARKQAGIYMAVPFIIGALIIPLFGFLIDKFGKRAYMTLVSSIMTAIVFLLFYFCEPMFPLILIGVTYSLFASVIWPSISLIIPKPLLGFAYGVTTSIQQLGVAINPLIVAAMYINTKSYNLALGFFSALGMISVGFSLWLISENKKCNNILDSFEFEDKDEKTDEGIKIEAGKGNLEIRDGDNENMSLLIPKEDDQT